MPMTSFAYGAVVAGAAALFAIGTPAERSRALLLNEPTPNVPAVQLVAATTPSPAPSIVAAAGVTLHSDSFTLPSSDRVFPGGAAADAINGNCVSCHSAGMVLNQPPLSKAAWQSEVAKMRDMYKAPIAAEDVPAIVAYLTETKGAP
jgi:mono/diheme cytochrome c family protein